MLSIVSSSEELAHFMLSQSLPLNDGFIDSVVEELAHSEIVKPAHVS